MQVAYICADAGVPVFGTKGCSVHVQEIIHQFLQRECDVTLLAVRSGGDNYLPANLFRFHEFPLQPCGSVSTREQLQTEVAARIANQLSTKRCDLVYERYSLWSCEALIRARLLKIPSVLEVNAPLIEEQLQHRQLVNVVQAAAIRDRAFSAATTIVAVSQGVADYVRSHLPASEHRKIHVVPNGVDTERFHPNVKPKSGNEHFTIGFLGTIKPWHGLESLLAAFELVQSRIPNTMLRIIGDGPMREILQGEVSERTPWLERHIQWTGAVHPQEVPSYLTSLDVAVAPYLNSTDFYFSPLKVYEYMAAGRAVVASSIGQLPTVIEHGCNGLLYKPGDHSQLAECLLQLAHQPELVRRLGEAARATAVAKHSWQHALDTILAFVSNDRDADSSISEWLLEDGLETDGDARLNFRTARRNEAAL